MLIVQPPKYLTTNNCKYSKANFCIYCRTSETLTDEHIIPYWLGGRSVLQKASCSECSKITSKFENNCLIKMYGPIRNLLGIPSRKDGIPKTVLIETKTKYLLDTIEEMPLSTGLIFRGDYNVIALIYACFMIDFYSGIPDMETQRNSHHALL